METKNIKTSKEAHKALLAYSKKHDRRIQNLSAQVIFLGLKKLEELEGKRR